MSDQKIETLEDKDPIADWSETPSLIKALSIIVGITMFSMMALVFVDVVGRYGFAHPIPGGFEITEFVMGTMIFSAVPIVCYHNSHITVGLFDHFFKGAVRRVQLSLVLLFTGCMVAFMGTQLFDSAQYMRSKGQVGLQLDIQVAPVVYGMAMMSFISALIVFALLFQYLRTGVEPESGGSLD